MFDPHFETTEDMENWMKSIGHQEVVITSDQDEVEVRGCQESTEKDCDCNICEDIKISPTQDYLCCNQQFQDWKKDLCDETEANRIKCVTNSEAFRASVNHHSVKVLLASLRENPEVRRKISNPPTRENMRFGSYKAAAYLLKQTQRKPLSSCIVAVIRNLYPDPNYNYTGFIEPKK